MTFLLHIFLFSDSGYFTRQKLEDRLVAIRGQMEELENENAFLQQEYGELEDKGAALPESESGATILTFESRNKPEVQFTDHMERKLSDPEMIFFLIMSFLAASAMIVTQMFFPRISRDAR
ncbi:MAG: hypothetical protein JNM27_04705 [Leptospirales bacterium]|nr:hypothetical protein [Leptospirales bacterium]